MCDPFADKYWKVAVTKVKTLEAMGEWKVIDQIEDVNEKINDPACVMSRTGHVITVAECPVL